MWVGDHVAIKEIPGTRLASKRKPIWGTIIHINGDLLAKDENRWCVVITHTDIGFDNTYRSRRKISLQRRHFDIPEEDKVPDWVWAEIARKALTMEGSD